ncbi:hypothetical protein ES708_12064 [subsurface metagenome]
MTLKLEQDWKDIVHRCFRCGYCKFTYDYSDFNCPSYKKFRFETYSTGGRLWLIYGLIESFVIIPMVPNELINKPIKSGMGPLVNQ